MIAANDAHIIVESVQSEVGRTRRGAHNEAASGAVDRERCVIGSRKVGVDSEVPHAAIALAEVRFGFATDKIVPIGAETVNDVGTKQIRASACYGLIRSVHSIH